MTNYEMMILTDPKFEQADLTKLLHTVINTKDAKVEKLARTELAYQIKKHKRASYFLVTTKTDPKNIAELVRKLNINKQVLRSLIINLDSEKTTKQKRMPKKFFNKNKRFASQNEKPEASENEHKHTKETSESTNKKVVKTAKTTVKKTTKTKKEETK